MKENGADAVAVSVILPIFNAGGDLRAALDRVIATCSPSDEVIIVDDGSTDDSLGVATTWADGRSNVRIIALDANSGVANARNTALASARGEYLWFVDWDDDWRSDIVQTLWGRARDTDADVVVCGARWRTADGLVLGPAEELPERDLLDAQQAIESMLEGRLKGYLWTKLVRRSLIELPAFPPMRSQSDFCGVVRFMARASKVAVHREVLYWHVVRDGSITNSKAPVLDNLDRCREAIRDASEILPPSSRAHRLKVGYDYEYWLLSRVHTALRLSSPEVARDEVEKALRTMKWRDVTDLVTYKPRTAVRASALMIMRRAYVPAWRSFVAGRARVRRLRGRLSRT